jgi:hypothetical protein
LALWTKADASNELIVEYIDSSSSLLGPTDLFESQFVCEDDFVFPNGIIAPDGMTFTTTLSLEGALYHSL